MQNKNKAYSRRFFFVSGVLTLGVFGIALDLYRKEKLDFLFPVKKISLKDSVDKRIIPFAYFNISGINHCEFHEAVKELKSLHNKSFLEKNSFKDRLYYYSCVFSFFEKKLIREYSKCLREDYESDMSVGIKKNQIISDFRLLLNSIGQCFNKIEKVQTVLVNGKDNLSDFLDGKDKDDFPTQVKKFYEEFKISSVPESDEILYLERKDLNAIDEAIKKSDVFNKIKQEAEGGCTDDDILKAIKKNLNPYFNDFLNNDV